MGPAPDCKECGTDHDSIGCRPRIEWFLLEGSSVHECTSCGGLTNNPSSTLCRGCQRKAGAA